MLPACTKILASGHAGFAKVEVKKNLPDKLFIEVGAPAFMRGRSAFNALRERASTLITRFSAAMPKPPLHT